MSRVIGETGYIGVISVIAVRSGERLLPADFSDGAIQAVRFRRGDDSGDPTPVEIKIMGRLVFSGHPDALDEWIYLKSTIGFAHGDVSQTRGPPGRIFLQIIHFTEAR